VTGRHPSALAIALRPYNSDAYSNRGSIYELIGQRDKAISDYRAALNLRPNDTLAVVQGAINTHDIRPMVEVTDPSLKRLFSDWENRRRGRAFPSRADFTPFDLKYVLGNLSLVDVTYDPLQFHYRLHASNMVNRFGTDMTNKIIDEMPTPIHAGMAKEHYTEVVERRVPTARYREPDLININAPHSCEVLVLPLSADGKTINMLMCAMLWDE
jgi:hypothetical protein